VHQSILDGRVFPDDLGNVIQRKYPLNVTDSMMPLTACPTYLLSPECLKFGYTEDMTDPCMMQNMDISPTSATVRVVWSVVFDRTVQFFGTKSG